MAKRILLIGLIFLFVFNLAAPAYCDDALRKLGRGISNVLTFPFEIPEQARRVNDTDGPVAALTYGMLKGIVMSGIRAVTGVYEIATFPIPVPRDYRPILNDPEFLFEEMIG